VQKQLLVMPAAMLASTLQSRSWTATPSTPTSATGSGVVIDSEEMHPASPAEAGCIPPGVKSATSAGMHLIGDGRPAEIRRDG